MTSDVNYQMMSFVRQQLYQPNHVTVIYSNWKSKNCKFRNFCDVFINVQNATGGRIPIIRPHILAMYTVFDISLFYL